MAQYKSITATGQVTVKAGKIYGFICPVASGGPTIAIYDSKAASASDPTILATFTPVAGTNYPFVPSQGVFVSNGIYVVIANTVTVTIFYE